MKKFTYYCRLRPPTPGAIPKDGIVEVVDKKIVKNNMKYWGYVTYNRELTKKELYQYDLEKIYTQKELDRLFEDWLLEMVEYNEDDFREYRHNEEIYNDFLNSL